MFVFKGLMRDFACMQYYYPFCAQLNTEVRTVTSYAFWCQLFIKATYIIRDNISCIVSSSHIHTSLTKPTIMLTLETIDTVD